MYACTHVCMLGIEYFLDPRSSPGTPWQLASLSAPPCLKAQLLVVRPWQCQWLTPTAFEHIKSIKNCGKAWKSMMHDAHDFCLKLFDKISHCIFLHVTWYGLTKNDPNSCKTIPSQIGKMSEVSHTTELCKHIALPGQMSLSFLVNYFNLELPNKLLSMSQWDSCKSQTPSVTCSESRTFSFRLCRNTVSLMSIWGFS